MTDDLNERLVAAREKFYEAMHDYGRLLNEAHDRDRTERVARGELSESAALVEKAAEARVREAWAGGAQIAEPGSEIHVERLERAKAIAHDRHAPRARRAA